MSWSLLIKNGTVIDGSGAARGKADVAIAGDRIVAMAPELAGDADRVIDATALVVAPGFIDIHSHSDFFYEQCPSAESKIRQGVTTEVVGMCSFSPAPCTRESRHQVELAANSLGATLEVRWSTFGEYLDALEQAHPSINVVHFVGHGPIRYAAMGAENRAPSAIELDSMKGLLAEAMDAGAYGLSSGLVYAPSAFAKTEELIALCQSMASRGGQYFTHMRGEAHTLLDFGCRSSPYRRRKARFRCRSRTSNRSAGRIGRCSTGRSSSSTRRASAGSMPPPTSIPMRRAARS